MYETPPSAEALKDEVKLSLLDIADFVETEEFQQLLVELWETPQDERPSFVRNVILNDVELAKRGVKVPEGMVLQRSAFSDDRPTLFCVCKKLSYGQRKVTITFDNEPGVEEEQRIVGSPAS
jgi:hypothetical protein